jgi:hypothetical protein
VSAKTLIRDIGTAVAVIVICVVVVLLLNLLLGTTGGAG